MAKPPKTRPVKNSWTRWSPDQARESYDAIRAADAARVEAAEEAAEEARLVGRAAFMRGHSAAAAAGADADFDRALQDRLGASSSSGPVDTVFLGTALPYSYYAYRFKLWGWS